jgi:hypothetical protein
MLFPSREEAAAAGPYAKTQPICLQCFKKVIWKAWKSVLQQNIASRNVNVTEHNCY